MRLQEMRADPRQRKPIEDADGDGREHAPPRTQVTRDNAEHQHDPRKVMDPRHRRQQHSEQPDDGNARNLIALLGQHPSPPVTNDGHDDEKHGKERGPHTARQRATQQRAAQRLVRRARVAAEPVAVEQRAAPVVAAVHWCKQRREHGEPNGRSGCHDGSPPPTGEPQVGQEDQRSQLDGGGKADQQPARPARSAYDAVEQAQRDEDDVNLSEANAVPDRKQPTGCSDQETKADRPCSAEARKQRPEADGRDHRKQHELPDGPHPLRSRPRHHCQRHGDNRCDRWIRERQQLRWLGQE